MKVNMIEKKIVDSFKNLIDGLDVDEVYKKAIVDFMDTYDGNNANEFYSMLVAVSGLLVELKDLRIVEHGYNLIEEESEKTQDELDSIIRQFKDLNDGKLPPDPMVSTLEEDQVTD